MTPRETFPAMIVCGLVLALPAAAADKYQNALDRLIDELSNHGKITENVGGDPRIVWFRLDAPTRCDLAVTTKSHYNSSAARKTIITEYEDLLPAGKIIPNEIEVQQETKYSSNEWCVYANTDGKVVRTSISSSDGYRQSFWRARTFMCFNDEDAAKRSAKAFSDLARACGAGNTVKK